MSSILGEFGDKVISYIKDVLDKESKPKKKQVYADCVIRNSEGEILLLQRSYQDDFMKGKWCLVGGKVEENERPEVAALRELEEETAIGITDIKGYKFIKTIEKDDCTINYFQALLKSDDCVIVLDNAEHYRYAFVPVTELGNYEMILDLNEVITNDLLPELDQISTPLELRKLTPEEEIGFNYFDHDQIVKAFDEGEIEDEDFTKYLKVKGAIETITKAFDQDQISPTQFFDALEKGKHYEFVKVVRDGKTFYQYREVGTNKVEEDVETGTSVETNAILDLKITKYSDKSILITGNTYKNLQLLRDAKAAAGGLGTFNKTLGGWIFPSFAKDKIIALMADKMSIDTYDETVAKEAAIDLKNSVDVGTEVTTDGELAEVKEVTTDEAGKVVMTVETKDKTFEEKMKIAYGLGYDAFDKKILAPIHDKELLGLSAEPFKEEGIKLMAEWLRGKTKASLDAGNDTLFQPEVKEKPKEEPFSMMQDATGNEKGETIDDKLQLLAGKIAYVKKTIEEAQAANDPSAVKEYQGLLADYESELKELVKQKVDSLPIGSISPDGKYVKTADGWEYIKKEKKVKEDDVAIPPANDEQAADLINNATEENRFKTGKMIMGKEEGEKPVSETIEANNADPVKAPIKEFITRSGEKVQALDYSHIKQSDIQLVDQEGILDRPKPNWCVDINEKTFAGGHRDDLFVFDYVQLEGEKILLATNGYNKDVWGRNISDHVITNAELRQDLIDKKYTKEQIESANIWGTPERGYSIEIAGKKYVYSEETKKDWQADRETLLNNHEAAYAVVSIDQLVAMQDYYIKKRKAEIEKKKADETEAALSRVLAWDQKKLDYYYPFDYERRLSEKQKKKYTKEQWEALSIEEKVKEIPAMKKPAISLPSGKRVSPLSDNKMLKTNFEMYEKFVDKEYFKKYYETEPYWTKIKNHWYYNAELDPCANEYKEVREALQWRKVDLQVQREENDASYDKALQTSYGDTNMKDDLLDSHGVRVKLQNGKEIKANHIEQIKKNIDEVYGSFGDRSKMAKNFGLKISHAGDKLMFARKAMGIYIPSMKAIGVSDKQKGQFGFTLGHEFAHFMDNYVGKQQGRNYASDNVYSTAGKIASTYRRLMNAKTESNYINRSTECFARAFEQYHAVRTVGHDAAEVGDGKGTRYFEADFHVSKQNFDTHIKPLIEQFLQENDHLLKSAVDEIEIYDVDGAFELIKSAFNNEQMDVDTFMNYASMYEDIQKGDPSHGGKLVKKTIVDKKGHKTSEWVKRGEEEEKDKKTKTPEPVPHSHKVLAAFARETPEKELRRIISESSDEKLRKAAHAELKRRESQEKKKKEKA